MSTQNILNIFNQATEQEKNEGVLWYADAREFCKNAAKEYNISLEVVVAVISALSPRNKWKQNLKDAVTVLEAVRKGLGPDDVKVCTFHSNKRKAFAIVIENNPNLAKATAKTASFFDNIRFDESTAVTIDVHAYRVFTGDYGPAKSINGSQYSEAVKAYCEAAEITGLRAYELQAICWMAFKRIYKK
jgi:hypothetical protein